MLFSFILLAEAALVGLHVWGLYGEGRKRTKAAAIQNMAIREMEICCRKGSRIYDALATVSFSGFFCVGISSAL